MNLRCFVFALLSLRAGCTPIATGHGSATLQNNKLKFRERGATIGKAYQVLKLKSVVKEVKTKHHPHLSSLKKLLSDVSAALTKHDVLHHITGGTLVGWSRNKQIIPVSESCSGRGLIVACSYVFTLTLSGTAMLI